MKFVCPRPDVWNRIYEELCRIWREGDCQGEKPPVPLILAGWTYSNDQEKHTRWADTVRWAGERRMSALIPVLEKDECYFVESFSTYQIGPLGGPMYLPWTFEPKPVPSHEILDTALQRLSANWKAIAEQDLAAITEPARFTGRKGRRLVIRVLGPGKPRWGAWDRLAPDGSRRRFPVFAVASITRSRHTRSIT